MNYILHGKVLIENDGNQDITVYDKSDIPKIFKEFIKMYTKTYEDDTEYNMH